MAEEHPARVAGHPHCSGGDTDVVGIRDEEPLVTRPYLTPEGSP